MSGAKLHPSPPAEEDTGAAPFDVANLDDLKAFGDDASPNAPSTQPAPKRKLSVAEIQLAKASKASKKKVSPELAKARRASKLRKLYRILILLAYFAISLLYLSFMESTSTVKDVAVSSSLSLYITCLDDC